MKLVRRTGGVPARTISSSTPHFLSCITTPRISAWVDIVSVPGWSWSTTSTLAPCAERRRAVAAPAQRAPTITAS
jgi:hypothetical protein